MNTYATIDNLLWFGTHPIMVRQNILKDQKHGRVYIRFFICDWIFIGTTLIHSHHIHSHIPIRITIVIYNFMHVSRTRSWPSHHFYYGLVRNIWFSMCKPTQIFLHELFYRRCIITTSGSRNFLFLHLLHGHLIPPPLLFQGLNSTWLIKPWIPLQ
jgi:hypothetical protein